jgi:serine/threonine protein kinase
MFGKMQKIQFTETDTHIGKYELGRQIGSGQHSIVRKCYDLVSSRSYAIKILNDEEGMNQLQVELNAFHQLHPSHPNILTIHDYFIGMKGVYLVMEHSQFDLVQSHPATDVIYSSLPSPSLISWNTTMEFLI